MEAKTERIIKMPKIIYCVHSWVSHECGDVADIWRECIRCGTRWDSTSKKPSGNKWEWPSYLGLYCKEPKTVIGKIK